ncbi:MAG: hypothetical protein AAB539_04565 [Patescibacteria group bacterium]
MPNVLAKEFILAFLTFSSGVTASWYWFRFVPVLAAGEINDWATILIATLLLLGAAICFSVFTILVKSRGIMYATVALTAGVPYLFVPAEIPVLVAFGSSVLFLIVAASFIRTEHVLTPGFNTRKIIRAGLPLYFTIISLTVSIYYFVAVRPKSIVDIILPRPAFNASVRQLSRPITMLLGMAPIAPEQTVDDALKAYVTSDLQKRGIDASAIPAEELTKMIASVRENLAAQFNLTLDGKTSLPDAIYQNIGARADAIAGPYRKYFPFGAALLFFLTFKGLTLPLHYATILITAIVIKILIAIQFVKKQKEQVTVERLTL